MAIIINTFKKFFGSIRFKLFIIFTVVSIIPLIILSNLLITSFNDHFEVQKQREMSRKATTIATNLVVTGYFNEGNVTYLSSISALVEGRAIIINENATVVYDTNETEVGKTYTTNAVISGLQGKSSYEYLPQENVGRVIIPIIDSEASKTLGVVLLTNSFENIRDSVSNLKSIAILIVMGFIILILVLSYYTSYILTKPFKLFIKYIQGVTEGRVDEKLIVRGNNEIEEISTSFNHMIERFFEVEENRQQFVANVSHELKTPISSIKVLAESLLSRENVSTDLYREFLEDINSEIDREAKIINDLLTLVTLDKKDNKLNISKINVNELVESVLKRLNPLAGKKNIQMIFESYRSIVAEVDETKLTLAISNLVENAIKYNKDFGLITVSLNADHKEFELIVKDTGIGIPEDCIDNIFERFYRVDKTRSRDTGGTGLGLSIVQKTVLMHHGLVRCESVNERGTKFIVRVPLKHITIQ